MVKYKFFEQENARTFESAWRKAKNCAKKNLKEKDPEDEALTEEHMQAICVYTSEYEMFYRTFSDAVRINRNIYGTDFPFHSLHYWLTSAVQILSNNNNRCQTTYRQTTLELTGSVNQIIRFGFFASSSYDPGLTQFGQKTCFKIRTCSGAYLKQYAHFQLSEEEVLIPP